MYFDLDYRVALRSPQAGQCELEDGGREYVFPVHTANGLEVSAKVFVPAAGTAFVRHCGSSATPRPRRSPSRGTAGPRSTTRRRDVLTSSSGDEAVTPADDWFTFDNAADATDPANAYVWQGAAGPRRTSVDQLFAPCCTLTPDPIADGSSEPQWRYERIELAPGETAALMQFLLARPTADEARDAAAALAAGAARGLRGALRRRGPRAAQLRAAGRRPRRRRQRGRQLPERGQRRPGERRRRRAGRRVRRGRRQRRSLGRARGRCSGRTRRRPTATATARTTRWTSARGPRARCRTAARAFDAQQTVDVFAGRLDPAVDLRAARRARRQEAAVPLHGLRLDRPARRA